MRFQCTFVNHYVRTSSEGEKRNSDFTLLPVIDTASLRYLQFKCVLHSSWRKSKKYALAKFYVIHWRNSPRLSPVGENPPDLLANLRWTFAIGECRIGESLIGEIRKPHIDTRIFKRILIIIITKRVR